MELMIADCPHKWMAFMYRKVSCSLFCLIPYLLVLVLKWLVVHWLEKFGFYIIFSHWLLRDTGTLKNNKVRRNLFITIIQLDSLGFKNGCLFVLQYLLLWGMTICLCIFPNPPSKKKKEEDSAIDWSSLQTLGCTVH